MRVFPEIGHRRKLTPDTPLGTTSAKFGDDGRLEAQRNPWRAA